ncbi:putative RNA polymerase sigma factor FecI [Rhodocyclaceae bacterium]|nr:putative RNA polymerase sigma factor FecI [Rhodocyclaceae bacterium]
MSQSLSLADLFQRYAAELRAYLRTRRGSADAEDLVQESFVRLLQASAASPPDDPRAWLYRTSANLAADAYDHRMVRERLHVEWPEMDEEVADVCADPARQVEAGQGLRQVWRALMGLPEPCRQAFLLNRLDGLSQRAIAIQLGLSEKTVERHILRALEACRRAHGGGGVSP